MLFICKPALKLQPDIIISRNKAHNSTTFSFSAEHFPISPALPSPSPWPVEHGGVRGRRGMSGSAVCCGSKVVRAAWSVAHACLELWRLLPEPDLALGSSSCPQPEHPGRAERRSDEAKKKKTTYLQISIFLTLPIPFLTLRAGSELFKPQTSSCI